MDDTLFQTKRKILSDDLMVQQGLIVAALSRQRLPQSFMTEEQSNFVQWLLNYANVIPVTGRSTEEFNRVQLPFTYWSITTHGGVILTPEGEIALEWRDYLGPLIKKKCGDLHQIKKTIEKIITNEGVDAFVRIVYEYDNIPMYLIIKHSDSSKEKELDFIADKINNNTLKKDYYIHHNGNNISIIPTCISKGHAVEWLFKKLKTSEICIPIIGLGDSLSDYSFLKECSWFAIPKRSQFAHEISEMLFGEK